MPRSLLVALAGLGIILTLTVIPGVFTIDEDHYLVTVAALRQGRLTVSGTEGLTPSRELRWFDPMGPYQAVESTPVSATVPPLYAPLALPFSWLGWRGLVLLNTLAFLAAAWIVGLYARRYQPDSGAAPWLAAGAFALGGYAIEYAQGLWPHMLSAALVIGAAYLAARVRDGDGVLYAALGGLAAGLAVGLRYQNILLAACLGLTIFLWAPRRWRDATAFAAGVGLPLTLSSLLNHLRLGFWNPISKGPGYLGGSLPKEAGSFLGDALRMAWARIGDFATRPSLAGTEHALYLRPDPITGAYLVGPVVKKAWLQSSPWIALALAMLALAWVSRRTEGEAAEAVRRRRELRALSLLVVPTLLMFSASGVGRTDGLCFNQRYFIELVPLVAVAFAWAFPVSRSLRRGAVAAGFVVGGALAFAALQPSPGSPLRQMAILYAPLLLCLVLLSCWILGSRAGAGSSGRATLAFALSVGLSLGWSLAVHVGDDLAASRSLRRQNHVAASALARVLPDGAALFAWWGSKDSAGPLLLDRDLVVLDARNDEAQSAPRLARELAERGYPVFVIANGFSLADLERLRGRAAARVVAREPFLVIELDGAALRSSPSP